MRTRLFQVVALGLPLLLIGGSPVLSQAAETEQKAQMPASAGKMENKGEAVEKATEAKETPKTKAEVKRPAGFVGTVVAFTPATETLVVDVPLAKDVLRVGAQVTDRTKIREGGKEVSPDNLKQGERVRINYHRNASGDVATAVDILRAAKG